MQAAVQGLKPENLWNYFSDLSDIPRESGNEEGVRQFLLAFAKEHALEAIVDDIGNVIIRKKAYPGYENRSSVALQGHMDMVCVKVEGSTHDFATDPIELVRDGDFLKANGTTLGGDNGIAIALALDILADPACKHGPLRGRAIAGATGNTSARIVTTNFGPEIVSIAGVYKTFENGVDPAVAGQAAHVRLCPDAQQQRLTVEALRLD